ncbi:sulfotransferase family 2 domain-containing protein [Candidatus Woesebacteria bacterium]|nr:sulfotransferase family 2 domain-containing protein [Candidatus Woesebacteria bacterium]
MPKCAGTTIAYHIEKNYSKIERIYLYADSVTNTPYDIASGNYDENKLPIEVLNKKVENRIKNMNKDKRSKIKILYGHHAFYGIHEFFDRQPYYFTFLRDPLERTVSMYNYWCKSYFFFNNYEDTKKGNVLKILQYGVPPRIEEWINEIYVGNKNHYPRGSMANLLIKSNYIDASSKSDIASNLNKFEFIGLVKSFQEDSFYLYQNMGFNKFCDNQNISYNYFNKKYMPRKNWKTLKKKIVALNREDYSLYYKALKLNEKYKKVNNNFYPDVNKLLYRRRVFTPFSRRVPIIKKFITDFLN